MRKWPVVATLLLPVLIASCEKPKSAAQQAREDARAIAMVEAAQDAKAPPVPLEPQPITTADIQANAFYGAGCNLVPVTQPGGDPVLVANERRAIMKVAGKFVSFAADPGSATLAMGTRTHYVGKAQSLFLQKAVGDGTRLGDEASRWDGSLTIRDEHDQLVYSSSGELVCGS